MGATNQRPQLGPINEGNGINFEDRMEIIYFSNEAKLQIPVAGIQGTPARMVQTHAPVGEQWVVWVRWRWGTLPEIPSPDRNDTNLVLYDKQIQLISPQMWDENSVLLGIMGIYKYYEKVPTRVGKDSLKSGASAMRTPGHVVYGPDTVGRNAIP